MITPAQIRGARAVLDWTQAELAVKTGISLRALNSIERGLATPRIDNLRFIQEALEKAGIEFTEFDGVRRHTERMEIAHFEGERYYDQHVRDMMAEMQTPGGEILYSFQSDEEYENLPAPLLDEYWQHLHRYQITECSLTGRGNIWIMGKPSTYRWLKRSLFNHVGYIVYGDNVAFLIAAKPHRMIVMRNPAIADMFRRQFDENWRAAEIPWFAKEYRDENPNGAWSEAKAATTRAWIEKMKTKRKLPS